MKKTIKFPQTKMKRLGIFTTQVPIGNVMPTETTTDPTTSIPITTTHLM